jgi:hypothetical protein
VVAVSAALVADLKALTDVLDEPGIDLEALLRTVAADTRLAVDSYLGLTMTLMIDGYPITLTAIDPDDIATSLRLPLDVLGHTDPGSVLVLYAAKPGAFVDLAADLSFALGLSPNTMTLDDDLTPTSDDPAGLQGLAEMVQVNQAIGILIERGHLPDSARTRTTPPRSPHPHHARRRRAATNPHHAAHHHHDQTAMNTAPLRGLVTFRRDVFLIRSRRLSIQPARN